MKNSFLLLPFLCFTGLIGFAQGPKVGDKLPPFTLDRVVNSQRPTISAADAAGKLLIIEFWGTWCTPCIPALRHLDSLQKQFADDLVVIAVSDDSVERLQKFLTKYPVSIPLASDPKRVMQRLFKYQMVPHTIVVDRNQRIVAVTTPDQLSETVINKLIKKQSVSLAVKEDAEFDPKKDYFNADSATRFSVETKPYMEGFPSFSRPGRGAFQDRRLTFINVLPDMVFQRAYDVSSVRIKNERPKELTAFEPENILCFDIIVPEAQKAGLNKMMLAEAEKRFPIHAELIKRNVPVYILTQDKTQKSFTPSRRKQLFSSGGGGIEAAGAPMNVLRDYVENTLNRPVLDETGLTDKYDFNLEVRQEDLKQSMAESLKKLGLTLVEATRDIDFLVLRSK